MSTLRHTLGAITAVVALASGAALVTPLHSAARETEVKTASNAAEHTAEAAKYEQEALDLDSKAEHHARMAKQYRARYSGGSKQATALRSLIEHCERLSKAYREAAAEAREVSKSHFAMAKPG